MAKQIVYIFCLMLLLSGGTMLYGRQSERLFSIGNGLSWNNASAWSLSPSGSPCGLIPQSNDSIIISTTIHLNSDIILEGYGHLEISHSGNLKGSAYSLLLKGSSSMLNSGRVQIFNLSVRENAGLEVLPSGSLSVIHDFIHESELPVLVDGDMNVLGSLKCGTQSGSNAEINGTGFVRSSVFMGYGSIMSMSPAMTLPSHSVVSGYTWIGSQNSDWDNSLNWSNQIIPSSSSNVAILKGTYLPHIMNEGFCRQLVLSTGSGIFMEAGSSLIVDGNLEVPAGSGFHLLNLSGKPASLIIKGDIEGSISSEIQVSPNTPMLVSSPVSEALSGVFVNMYLREYDESSSQWGNYIVPTDISLQSMQGYQLFSPYASTRIFEGKPNTGIIAQAVSLDEAGLNLIGNPFPCYLDWKFEGTGGEGWDRNSISRAIYYPDPSGSGNYAVYLPGDEDVSINHGSRYIAPMQGFFVKARQAGAVKVDIKAAASQMDQPSTGVGFSSLKFRVEGSNYRDESVIRFEESSTMGFDDDLDALKMMGDDPALSLCSVDSDLQSLAVNTMPSLSSTLQVPLVFTCREDEEFKLVLSGGQNFMYRYPITLEDKVNHTFIDLRADSTYIFQHSPNTDKYRFILHFDEAQGVGDLLLDDHRIVFQDGSIKLNGFENQPGKLDIVGIDGRVLYSKTSILTPDYSISPDGIHGVVVVRATTKSTSYAKQILLP